MERISVVNNKRREALDYAKKHPYDTLQPGDKMFDKVWGAEIKKREDKMEKGKRGAEEEYAERKVWKSNRTGGEWKRKYFI